jgi:NTP pyrophosphatase (non-canonical NTP hydrolase)
MTTLRPTTVFANEVEAELERARKRFPPIHSLHEGYAVILEEVDEFFEDVRSNDVERLNRAYRELIQIAAMAQRTAEDCVSFPEPLR